MVVEKIMENIEYHPNGTIKSIKISNDKGFLHNIVGPAEIYFHPHNFREEIKDNKGFLWHERWHVNGIAHRADGPAIVLYSASLSSQKSIVTGRLFIINGVDVTKKAEQIISKFKFIDHRMWTSEDKVMFRMLIDADCGD